MQVNTKFMFFILYLIWVFKHVGSWMNISKFKPHVKSGEKSQESHNPLLNTMSLTPDQRN
jgi:hypothetical protein